MDDLEETQQLQNKVDRLKTLSLLNNAHNLAPPIKRDVDDNESQITIIKALESAPRLKEIFLEARGLVFDEKENKIVQISRPFLNVHGAWKLVAECKKIAQEAEWSNFQEENIPSYMDHFFRETFPYFTFWHEDYDLDPKDFDYVRLTLQMFILSSFYKAKGGKYVNLIGKTYSEDLLGKVMNQENNKRTREGFLDRYNPFKERK
jgi:hypothetical protein